MKVTIDATTHSLIRFWFVPLGIVIAGYAIYSARTALIILLSALFLALALNGPVTKLANFMPGKSRLISTTLSFILVVAFIGSFLFLAMPPIIQQTAKFAQTIPDLVDSARSESGALQNFIDQYQLQDQVDNAVTSIQDNAARWASGVGADLIAGIGSLFSFLAALILTLVLSFLMLLEGPAWMRRIWGLYYDKEQRDYHRTITRKIHHVVSSYVTGQLAVSGLGAIAAGLAVFALSFFFSIPSNLAIPTAAVTFILSLIPMFGATLAGGLITLLLLLNDVNAAIIYLAFFIIYQQIENNYISPVIQSRQLQLSALAVLASVTIGLYLFGIAGGIISIPIAGSIKVILDAYLERREQKHQRYLKKKAPHKKLADKISKST